MIHRSRHLLILLVTTCMVVQTSPSFAQPTGGQVTGGQATISSSGNKTTINQNTGSAVIDWSSFNIGSNEAVQFVQPSASSIALNRIHDSGASSIDGQLTANGNVWLLNPNGVMFGNNAQVNVGGLLATTSNISNSDFMAGNYHFTPGSNPNATLSNAGNITVAQSGIAAFVAPNVVNNGVINATLGKVQLGSGDSFTLDLYGDGLVNLQASNALNSQLVANHGKISANGGKVALTAAAASNAVNSVVNNDGIIEANSIGSQNGVITLYAEGSNAVQNNVTANKGQKTGSSTVNVSGTLSAQGSNTGETGGSISVLGDNVNIQSGANINASGNTGGGTIQIGGDFHGQGITPTALATTVQANSSINADATNTGNGGNVTVWSDNYTNFCRIYLRKGRH